MDVPVIISHRTAAQFYHAANRRDVIASRRDYGIAEPGIKASVIAGRIRQALTDCGIPQRELKCMDTLVFAPFGRSNSRMFSTHMARTIIPSSRLLHVCHGLFVVGPELCFVQASMFQKA